MWLITELCLAVSADWGSVSEFNSYSSMPDIWQWIIISTRKITNVTQVNKKTKKKGLNNHSETMYQVKGSMTQRAVIRGWGWCMCLCADSPSLASNTMTCEQTWKEHSKYAHSVQWLVEYTNILPTTNQTNQEYSGHMENCC